MTDPHGVAHAWIEGQILMGYIRSGMDKDMRLTGVRAIGPVQRIRLEKPVDSMYVRFKHPYAEPTPEEYERWQRATFKTDNKVYFLDDIILLKPLPCCGNCSEASYGLEGDFLCAKCRHG